MFVVIMLVGVLLPCSAAIVIVMLALRRQSRFINPLTKSLRRPAGAQLGRQLAREQIDLMSSMYELLWPAVFPISGFIIGRGFSSSTQLSMVAAAFGVALLIWIYLFKIFNRRIDRLHALRLGYECEVAVGQELDLLMRDGFQVFHDLPAEGFNIDHIVVGASGVFAVETKGRSKRFLDKNANTKAFRVAYREGELHFPGFRDSTSVQQTLRQSKWLSKWLTSAIGMEVRAEPVLILPGWFVDLKERPPIPIIASGYINGFFTKQSGRRLSEEQIGRIVHQLDARVRDIELGDLARPIPVP